MVAKNRERLEPQHAPGNGRSLSLQILETVGKHASRAHFRGHEALDMSPVVNASLKSRAHRSMFASACGIAHRYFMPRLSAVPHLPLRIDDFSIREGEELAASHLDTLTARCCASKRPLQHPEVAGCEMSIIEY